MPICKKCEKPFELAKKTGKKQKYCTACANHRGERKIRQKIEIQESPWYLKGELYDCKCPRCGGYHKERFPHKPLVTSRQYCTKCAVFVYMQTGCAGNEIYLAI